MRYSSPLAGNHHYRTECSDATDSGLNGVEGDLTVTAYKGDNPLLTHGALRVAADHRHFAHADGTPFFWLGDTWWMGLCNRLKWPQDFQTLAQDRRAKGFTVVQIVAGLYPDMPAFDRRGANEAGFPWTTNYSTIRPEYFDAADRRVMYLADQGFVPCVVGAWGYHLPWLGASKMKAHWRYLIARWGALPVVWCAAGEGAMPFYLSKDQAGDRELQKREWTEVIRYIHATDPYHRLVTIHPPEQARDSIADPSALDFDMQQSGHGSAAERHAALALTGWNRQPVMPVISGESRYEALEIGRKLDATDARQAFWAHLLNNGCAGHTYGANGIWQVNRADELYGKSPAGNNWGTTPWNEAMQLPGSSQIGAAKRWLEKLPWWRFEPHPEWIASDADSQAPPALGDWIWLEPGALTNAPVEPRYFRRVFDLPRSPQIKRARLRVTADDLFASWVNGDEIGSGNNWREPRVFDIARHLHPGRNVIAIRAENSRGPVNANPAGLNATLELEFDNSNMAAVSTGASWRVAREESPDWRRVDFNERSWRPAAVLGKYGCAPWGKLENQSAFTPIAAGEPNGVRVFYLLAPGRVTLRQLQHGASYRVSYFDPVEGRETGNGSMRADSIGEIHLPIPPYGHDLAIKLEPR